MSRRSVLLCTIAVCLGLSAHVRAEDVEVLHFWTSGGESRAAGVLKQILERQGYTWRDSAIAGGGGANAMTVLKTRVVSGNPPVAAAVRGPAVQDWASQDALAPLDQVADGWRNVLPPAVDAVLKLDGHYYAAPHWIHRVNWMWINKPLMERVGGKVPTNWDEFFDLADRLKRAGYVAIAHGETAYEDGVLFENVVLSMGVDFYRKAILEYDQATLRSAQMVQVFDILRRMQSYFDDGQQGRAWNLSVAMLIENKAGMFFMGDWAKGEFSNASKVPDQDYICAPDPGTAGSFTFIADTFVFFRQNDGQATKAQLDIARDIMSPEYQEVSAAYKGSIPANTTASMSRFDACAQKSAADLRTAAAANALVPSMNQGTDEARLGARRDVIVRFMASRQDSKAAAAAFADTSRPQ